MRIVLVTGTGTGVGKTVATAALACMAHQRGRQVSVVKPVQTGTRSDEPTDIAVVRRLSGCEDVAELVTLEAPLAPETAARLAGRHLPKASELAHLCVEAGPAADVLLIEGVGGILVRLDSEGGTLLDIGRHLLETHHHVQAVVVTSLALGTLNHTELTVRAVEQAGLDVAGLVVGSRPGELGLAERSNIDDLPRVTGRPVLGAIPERAGARPVEEFQAQCQTWLADAQGLLGLISPVSGRRRAADPPAAS
jgi:dethiobiotin synthetase